MTIPASDNVFPIVRLSEETAPSTPASGEVHMYALSDGILYAKDDAGLVQPVSGGERLIPKATGVYFSNVAFGNSGAPPTPDRLSYAGLWLPSGTVDRLGVWVTAGGAAGAVVRLGLYGTTGGFPATLLVDGGTVAATTTGFKEVTISQAITAGLYWVAAAPQGTGTPDWVHTGSAPQAWLGQTSVDNSTYGGYRQDSVTGALPGTATPIVAGFGGNNARVWVKVLGMTQYTDRHETWQDGVLVESHDVVIERSGEEERRYLAGPKLRQAYAALNQWSQDAATTNTNWATMTAGQKDAAMRETIRRLGVFFDHFADLLLLDGKS